MCLCKAQKFNNEWRIDTTNQERVRLTYLFKLLQIIALFGVHK